MLIFMTLMDLTVEFNNALVSFIVQAVKTAAFYVNCNFKLVLGYCTMYDENTVIVQIDNYGLIIVQYRDPDGNLQYITEYHMLGKKYNPDRCNFMHTPNVHLIIELSYRLKGSLNRLRGQKSTRCTSDETDFILWTKRHITRIPLTLIDSSGNPNVKYHHVLIGMMRRYLLPDVVKAYDAIWN